MLHGVGVMLSPLGWVLHGLRLFINVIELLQQMTLDIEIHDTDKAQVWCQSIEKFLQNHGTAIGNDVIWVLAALAPEDLLFSCVFLMIDVLWLRGQFWSKTKQLSALNDGTDLMEGCHLAGETAKKMALEWQIFLLNLTRLLSINIISIMRHCILPTFFPILALNPWLLLTGSLLSLVITLTSHFLEKAWVGLGRVIN